MPPRARHIPHNLERTVLQKMSPNRAMRLADLHPGGCKLLQICKRRAGSNAIWMTATGWAIVKSLPDRLP